MAKNKVTATDVLELEVPAEEAPAPKEFHLERLKRVGSSHCCATCLKIMYVLLGIMNILLSVGVIAFAVLASVTTKMYDTDQSHRLAAMVLLIFTAGLALSLIISGLVAMWQSNTKTMHVVTVILIVLAVIQAVIVGACVNVTPKEEQALAKSLAESFKLAQEGSPRHVKLWDSTQYDLNCCGVYGAEDYRGKGSPYYFPPNVPISCCPNYDPSRSDMGQEREREVCRAKKTFNDVGCSNPVLEVFKETAGYSIGVSVTLIITEVFLAIVGSLVIKKGKGTRKEPTEFCTMPSG